MSEADGRISRPRVAAFCSTAEDIGQTTTLLNTAVLLARSGRRVLVLDGRNADVRTRHYVRSVAPATALLPDEEGGPSVEEWSPSGAARPIGLATLKGPDPLAAVSGAGPDHPAFQGYDDVLIDAPLPRTEEQTAQLARLPDLLVVCFTADSSFIEDAAALAWGILRHAERPLDVIALALQTDWSHEDQLRIARDRVGPSFTRLYGRPVRYLEIPYHAMSARSARLGTELDSGNGFDERVLPALERLVAALDRPRPVAPAHVTLVHTSRHAVWADWIEAQLHALGVGVARRTYSGWRPERPAEDAAVLLLQPTTVRPDEQRALRALSDPLIRMVLIDGETLPPGFAHHQQIDLRRHDAQRAAELLLRALSLPVPRRLPSSPHRFPSVPNRTNIAARSVTFVGREDLLDDIREALRGLAGQGRPCLLRGAPGVGKSEALLEFCHRFGGSYDVVWWLRADASENVRASLAALGDALGEPTAQELSGHIRALRARADETGERWLLVCDELDDVEMLGEVTDLLPAPSADCHILFAARGGQGPAPAGAVQVAPFSRGESEALLLTLLPGLKPSHARDVVHRVGPLPLALRLAACWIGAEATRVGERDNLSEAQARHTAVDAFLDAFTDQQQTYGPGALAGTQILLRMARSSVRSSAAAEAWAHEPAGVGALNWLIDACALITGAGVDLRMLRSRPMRAALAEAGPDHTADGKPVRPADVLLVDAALWVLHQHGLVEFDFARPGQPVRQHRVLRDLIVAQLGDEARIRTQLRAALGADLLGMADGPAPPDSETITRRGRQIEALRLWEDTRPSVQQSLLSHLADLVRTQEEEALKECLRVGRLALRSWTEHDCLEHRRLRALLSDAQHLRGEYEESGGLALGVLREYRGNLGLAHPRSLQMADSYAANLGSAGHVADALDEALHVARGMARLLGPRHGSTERVRRNLAWCYAAAGDYTEGMRLYRQVYEQRRAIGGDDDPAVRDMVPWLAEMHRLLGQDAESYQLLKHGWAPRSTARPAVNRVPITVVAENGLAVSERRLGDPDRAWERDTRALDMAVSVLGERHMITQRCRFSLAVDHHLLGEHEPAVEYAERCLTALAGRFGPDHPSTHLCRMRLGVHLRGAGRPEEAREAGLAARRGLKAILGGRHPWTLASAIALAGTLVVCGAEEEAAELEESAQRGYDHLGLNRHPARAIAAGNLAMTRAGQRGASGSGELPRVRRDIDVELFV
ncbi:FxSxx-COOH system tetratricopeptide repeat protein [Streptomyces qaidamensis]|jgi:tetratricopeptide (TPR) repeat protein|uniref:FxSxx-COOH system tetratricopeptide repeat protein n=1 Tax=Streptomyces qaidamensis TaxID=1783515 RepID=UPI0036EBC19F